MDASECKNVVQSTVVAVPRRLQLGSTSSKLALYWKGFHTIPNRTTKKSLLAKLGSNHKKNSHESQAYIYTYLNRRIVGKLFIGPVRLDNGILTDDPEFLLSCNNFVADLPPNDIAHQSCAHFSPTLTVNPDTVSVILKGLYLNSSMRNDCVHPRFYKMLSDELCIPLCITFNSSIY